MAGLMKIGKAMPENIKGVTGLGGVVQKDLGMGQWPTPLPAMKEGADQSYLAGTNVPDGATVPVTPPTTPSTEGQPPETGSQPIPPPAGGMQPGMGSPTPPPMPPASSATPLGAGTFLRPGQTGGGSRAALSAFRSHMFGMGGQPELRFGPGSPLASTGESMTFADAEGGDGKSLEDILAALAQGGGAA